MNQSEPTPPNTEKIIKQLQALRPTPRRNPDVAKQNRARFYRELEAVSELKTPETFIGSLCVFLGLVPSKKIKKDPTMNTSSRRFAFSTVMAVLLAALILFGGSGVTVFAAQSSLPGDTLYPVKQTVENTRAAAISGADEKAELELAYAEQRLEEISLLIAAGRYSDISKGAILYEAHLNRALDELQSLAVSDPARASQLAIQVTDLLHRYSAALSEIATQVPGDVQPEVERAIHMTRSASGEDSPGSVEDQSSDNTSPIDEMEITGTLESINGNVWIIDGQAVTVTTSTEVKGSLVVGDLVKVHASPSADGSLVAREIEIADSSDESVGDDSSMEDDSSSGIEDSDEDSSSIDDSEDDSTSLDNSGDSDSSGGDDEYNNSGTDDSGDDHSGGDVSGSDDSGDDHSGGDDNSGEDGHSGSDD
jgi:hypothetical protein